MITLSLVFCNFFYRNPPKTFFGGLVMHGVALVATIIVTLNILIIFGEIVCGIVFIICVLAGAPSKVTLIFGIGAIFLLAECFGAIGKNHK